VIGNQERWQEDFGCSVVVWIILTHHRHKVITQSRYERLIFKTDLIFYYKKGSAG
jgi:hypothetical protein